MKKKIKYITEKGVQVNDVGQLYGTKSTPIIILTEKQTYILKASTCSKDVKITYYMLFDI